VDRRSFRLSTTYRVAWIPAGPRQLSAAEVGHRVFGPVVSAGRGSSLLLGNGGRLRLDVAGQPEYATPDCASLLDLVVHDKAGERILEGLVVDAGQRLRADGIAGDISLVKADSQEHYLIGRRGEFGRLADLLIPFLVTRQIICGAGAVLPTPGGAVYGLSRRAGHPVPLGSGRPSRPLITTRDEPHAAAAGFRRLHVLVGEANMSETTMLLKAGATDLVLRMAEAAARLPDLTLDQPIKAIGTVSRDLTGRSRVRLADGREASALDIQREYLARASDFAAQSGADAVGGRMLGLWQRALDAIEAGNLEAIAPEIDWVSKYQLIERYRAEHDLPLSAPEVAQADVAYSDVRRDRGLYYRLQRRGEVARTARDIDIFEAKTVPPAPGRYRQAG
jgi:proteasome accessory factor A